jgi:hypothetical protein
MGCRLQVEDRGRPSLDGCLDKDSVHGHCLENEGVSMSQPCGPVQPVTGIALPFFSILQSPVRCWHSTLEWASAIFSTVPIYYSLSSHHLMFCSHQILTA